MAGVHPRQSYTVVSKYESVLDLIQDLTRTQTSACATVIFCATRDEFLRQIMSGIAAAKDQTTIETPSPPEHQSDPEAAIECAPDLHALLIPTLSLLSASRNISMVFCSSIPALRGYLSGHLPVPRVAVTGTSPAFPDTMVVVNMLRMHHGSTEFTLQGLSQTFATAVSTAHRCRYGLVLVECKDPDDTTNPSQGPNLWQAEVPLLSSSIKIGDGGTRWGRRTISVRSVASRWLHFEESAPRPIVEDAIPQHGGENAS